jgi:mRNA interferase MazF
MQTFQSGEIILVHHPFSDFQGMKLRPSLVLLDSGDEDVVVARVTRRTHSGLFDVPLDDWKYAGLMSSSTVRINKNLNVAKRLVKHRIGKLSEHDWLKTTQAVQRLWEDILPSP